MNACSPFHLRPSVFCFLFFSFFIFAAFAVDDSIVRNGDFEEPGKHWEIVHPDGGKFSYEEKGGAVGPVFLRMTPTDSRYPDLFAMQQYVKTVSQEGGKYRFRARVRISEDYGGRMPRLEANFKNPKTEKVEFIHLNVPKDAEADKWITVETDFEKPPEVAAMYIHLFVFGSMGHADFDGVEMVAAPVAKPKK